MRDAQTRTGGCSCGAVRFEAELDYDDLIACNCSNCGKKGLILGFVPPSAFRLTAGSDAAFEYLFNQHVIRHQLCRVCGTETHAVGRTPGGDEMVAVNARCIDDVDVSALNPAPVDGRAF